MTKFTVPDGRTARRTQPAEDVHRLTQLLARFNDGFTTHRSDILGAMAGQDRAHHPAPLLETS